MVVTGSDEVLVVMLEDVGIVVTGLEKDTYVFSYKCCQVCALLS